MQPTRSARALRALSPSVTTWDQWTTSMTVCVAAPDGGAADAATTARAVTAVRDHLDAVDAACSRFRPDSELSRLNEAARPLGPEPLTTRPVSPLLARHLLAALDAASHTDGAVDPTVGAALVACGYDLARGRAGFASGRAGSLRPADPQDQAPSAEVRLARRRDWRSIELLPSGRRWSVRLPRGTHLDLGATAKAQAADDACELAHQVTGAPVLVSLGGDLAAAGTPDGRAWSVAVRERPTDPATLVLVQDGGVATSTVLLRRWHQGGIARHHLIDPLTGIPVRGRLRTATVAARSCLVANAASTAVLVRPVGAVAWLREAGLAARLVDRDGRTERVGGWPDEAPEAAA